MDSDNINKMEFFALKSNLDIEDFGKEFSSYFNLPAMKYDFENDYEWLEVQSEGVIYNISKRKVGVEDEELNFPDECNYSIGLIYTKDFKYGERNVTVESFGSKLALFNNDNIYHYRSWDGVGKNTYMNIVITPASDRL
ncbi:hypothetical protein [Tenacibaculum xiamenense]|uniref:hypothetical protein n=1 Tax=Tenacibaculum xiamenense TaxID=1261553 RepID=UPI003894C5F3